MRENRGITKKQLAQTFSLLHPEMDIEEVEEITNSLYKQYIECEIDIIIDRLTGSLKIQDADSFLDKKYEGVESK